MIRRAVPNGPRVDTTVELVSVAAAAVDEDDLITVEVVEEVMDDVVDVVGGKRCFQPTSCIAEVVEVDPPTPDDDDDADDDVAALTFGVTRTVSFLIEFFFDSNVVLLPIVLALLSAAPATAALVR